MEETRCKEENMETKMEDTAVEKEDKESTYTTTGNSSITTNNNCCYHHFDDNSSLQQPKNFLDEFVRAVLKCLGLEQSSTPTTGGGGSGGSCGDGDLTSALEGPDAHSPPPSIIEDIFRKPAKMKPKKPGVSSGRGPQIN